MSKAKSKGTAFESLLVDYARANGHPFAHRNAQSGANDIGDIDLDQATKWTVEAKCKKVMSLGAWMDEAKREAEKAGRTRYAVAHKRVGKGDAAEQFVTMPFFLFLEIVRELEDGGL